MRIGTLQQRPWTCFDPSNKDHRSYFYQFVKTRTWSRCPVKFALPADHTDLVTAIQKDLSDYYATAEFK